MFATVTATATARATETATTMAAELYFSSEEVDEQLLSEINVIIVF